ncbi:MAG: HepT-like ribonuclease domain-containing protein [Bacteroidota bacterium]|nr:HepT-like ribonuclease domain-containing protein [Bacteroidota bacterium]
MHIKDKNKLDCILEAVEKIEKYTDGYTNADHLNENSIAFDATMMNFVVIGEMVSKLSDDFKDTHQEVDWIKVMGFRNIVAHDYFGIDAEEVLQIIQNKLPELKSFIESKKCSFE